MAVDHGCLGQAGAGGIERIAIEGVFSEVGNAVAVRIGGGKAVGRGLAGEKVRPSGR